MLLGSVTEHVVSQANCPVAVIHDATPHQRHRIVVGLDGSECSRRALDRAITQATLTGSTVEALLAWEWKPRYGVYPFGLEQDVVEEAAQRLLDSELALRPRNRTPVVHRRLAHGHAAKALLDASRAADALVVGNHRAGVAASRMPGSISQKVARHATGPVIVIHQHDHKTRADDTTRNQAPAKAETRET